jgi:hypothetical protein
MMPALMNSTKPLDLDKLYRRAIGELEPEPENWAMHCGSILEREMLDWQANVTGHEITRRGEVVHLHEHMFCTLDGYRAHDDAVIECKFLGPWRQKEEYLPWYYPQVIFQMICTGARNGVLLVAQGTSDPVEHEIIFDQAYADEMMARAAALLLCIRTLTPPVPLPPVIPPEKWRTVDLSIEQTNWGSELLGHLEMYEATRMEAEMHDEASKAAKELVPPDVGKVIAPTHHISRNKKGALTIYRRKN